MRYNEFIALRLPSELREQAEKLVEAGKYQNLSQVVRTAVREFLKKEGVQNKNGSA